MNKSSITSLVAFSATLIGWYVQLPLLLTMGLFALSGALTNWLAVHMLFERVPFLYGSGVIQLKFETFKTGIKELVVNQFLTQENLAKVSDTEAHIDFAPVISQLDMSPAFDRLVDVIEQSQFGSMLAMFGGSAALEPMREPFSQKMRVAMVDIVSNEHTQTLLAQHITANDTLRQQVLVLVDERLAELTPAMVKEIIQTMIRKHLGWLVVWGGVFGAAFGLLAHYL
ncbi:DUF445 domain-containing protein [Pseudoalteromonas sp. SSDWG2]|uniref:DUF445 domain-containing protein n=1 Tax=Pseudoalteromonas sp. SSDWG2 TaxID=3139391 RepID=UPI003BAA0D39